VTVRPITIIVGSIVCLLSTQRAQAQLSGTLGATLDLTTACIVSGQSVMTGADFGALDFGTHPATFAGVLQAQAAGLSGNTQIVCSADLTGVTISVDGGQHPGEGATVGDGTRALASGSNYVPYEIYSSAGTASPYPMGSPGVAVSIGSPGQPFTLPIFGRINKTSVSAVAAGTYQDTLQVTISF
jgi:spore coat protein U-like protein